MDSIFLKGCKDKMGPKGTCYLMIHKRLKWDPKGTSYLRLRKRFKWAHKTQRDLKGTNGLKGPRGTKQIQRN